MLSIRVEGSEDFSIGTEVGMAHMRALNCALHANCDASEFVRSHDVSLQSCEPCRPRLRSTANCENISHCKNKTSVCIRGIHPPERGFHGTSNNILVQSKLECRDASGGIRAFWSATTDVSHRGGRLSRV